MADITKRARKRVAHHLEPGETVEIAIFVEPRGTYGIGAVALVVAPRSAARKMAERADRAHDEQGGMAAGFPGEPAAIVVTQSRIIVVPTNGIRFGEPALVVPLGSLLVRSVERRGLAKRMQLVFTDGSMVTVDSQLLQPIDRFADTVGRTA